MAFLTFVLVVITGVYAWLTFRISRANEAVVALTRDQILAATRPYVTVSIRSDAVTGLFYLQIRNTGRTAAQDLRLELDRSYFQFGQKKPDRDLSTFNAFREPIGSLAPDAELLFYLVQPFVVFAPEADPDVTPVRFKVHARYSFANQTVSETTLVDLAPYLSTTTAHDPTKKAPEEVRAAIEKVAAAIVNLKNGG